MNYWGGKTRGRKKISPFGLFFLVSIAFWAIIEELDQWFDISENNKPS